MTDTQTCDAWHEQALQALAQRDFRRTHALCLQILALAPQYADAFYVLAVIAAEHDNYRKALDVAGRAAALRPNEARYPAFMARCCIALNEAARATQLALYALSLRGLDAQTLDTCGVALTRAGEYSKALPALQRAVALDSTVASYHYNLATVLQFNGEFTAAGAAYQCAVELDPDHHPAWVGLSGLEGGLNEVQARLVEQRLQRDIDAEGELMLCHALARHEETRGNHQQVFHWLRRGKQRKRDSVLYSAAADAELFEAVREVCSPQWLTAATAGYPTQEPIFIVGMPRTGTTLAERILSSHPQVHSAGELTEFALAVKRAAGTPSNKVLDAQTLRAASTIDFAALGEQYLLSTRPRTGHKPRFIDKMPLNFFYVGLIHRALPNARIVCMRRHPLDACLSNYRQLFATRFPYYDYNLDLLDTGRYYQQFDALMAHWRQHVPGRFMEVWYEDLVQDVEGQARKLLEFCGLPWHRACLDFHRNEAPVATASSVQVRQRVYRSSVERWRKYEFALAPLQALLADHLQRPDQGRDA